MSTRANQLHTWVSRNGARLSAASLIAVLGALIAWSWIESPKYPQLTRFGDDVEYLLGAQSFVRHGTPDYRPGDEADVLAQLPKKWRGSAALKYRPPRPSGYYEARDGRLFSWHFWSYPAAVAPFKGPLDQRGLGARAFHYANLLYFCLALATFVQLWAQPRLWLVLVPLAFFTPVLWFLPLVHTEPFVFSLGVCAMTCWLSERRVLAILFASLAATQFQPLAVCSFALCAEALWAYMGSRFDPRALKERKLAVAGCLAAAAVALIPNAFYLVHFGTPSVVTREGYAASRLVSVGKLASMFFDLNTGLIVYLPGVLLFFGWSLWRAARTAVSERSPWPLVLPASVIVALWISTSARIWNYHTQGISRYVLYAVPLMLLAIGLALRGARKLGPVIALAVVAVMLQWTVHREWGVFEYRGNNNLDHNVVAKYALERWPALYAPPPEIFCSRTLHKRCWNDLETGYVTGEYLPAIFTDSAGAPVKALVQPCSPEPTLAARSWDATQAELIREAAEGCKPGEPAAPRYLDFR